MAISAGLASYRFGLPLTIRSSFYPMLGDYCWGWMGDFIDAWSIVMTVGESTNESICIKWATLGHSQLTFSLSILYNLAGVCTSLGLGTIQLAAGMTKLGWVDADADSTTVNVIIIWVITAYVPCSSFLSVCNLD